MAGIILLYTAMGGLKAVIYTDTIQWIILLTGLLFFAIPFSYFKIGGLEVIQNELSEMHFSLLNIKPSLFINWMVTIIPMWFIGMTIYQRIYACKNTKEAQRAWYVAGVLEYPLIAFLGVSLGMMARVQFPQADPEMGIALLIRSSLPIGVTGIVIAAYFSAIMSTADSCLIASSGNFLNDILQKYFIKSLSHQSIIKISQLLTFILGCITLIIANSFATVLEIILHAYSLMVGGLFIPTLGAYFWKKSDSTAALAAMITGGTFTLYLIFSNQSMPYNLDASFYGILVSLVTFVSISQYKAQSQENKS
jgi:SSS family solute:Na+ symporter